MKSRIALTLVFSILLSGCISGVPVSIENRSSSDVTKVVVSGNGFSESVGTIKAGGKAFARVRPKGESGVKVVFEVNGQRYSGADDSRIENNDLYAVTVTVDADFSVAIETNLR